MSKNYDGLFKAPPSEYRGAPFWAWNSTLDPEVLEEQIEIMKEMGFGGFYMHVRQGLETRYMGEGKRDYPASIFYQSPWYKKYKVLEDHYARIAAAMSKGEPLTEIAVLHPIETFWMLNASKGETRRMCNDFDDRFHTLCSWLLEGGLDFDYLSEALLDDLAPTGGNPLKVGKMSYRAIVVCDCITLRPHTLEILEKFKAAGGKLIFMGDTPRMCGGIADNRAAALTDGASIIDFSRHKLYSLLEENRNVAIEYAGCDVTDNLMCSMREDSEGRWLFCAHTKKPELPHTAKKQGVKFTVDGIFVPTLYDTVNGEKKPIPYKAKNGKTVINAALYDLDSLLIRLDRTDKESELAPAATLGGGAIIPTKREGFRLEEPNVLLLDMAHYSVNGGELSELEEIMRIDERIRHELGIASRKQKTVQPWYISDYPENDRIKVVFPINSKIEIIGARLAIERPDRCEIRVNGEKIDNTPIGYYVDKDIKTLALPVLNVGVNEIEVEMPFGLRTDLEACYLVGDFGVEQIGDYTCVTQKPDILRYGSVTAQGLPFYGGNVVYRDSFALDEKSDVEFEISYYFGALVGVKVDGVERGHIIAPPFKLTAEGLDKGEHIVEYTLFGNRHNTFSALHNLVSERNRVYKGPTYWRSQNDEWAYEYQLKPMGILKTPIVRKMTNNS